MQFVYCPSVSCVPFAASRTALFSVYFGENRLSPGRIRLPLLPKVDPQQTEVGGNFRPGAVAQFMNFLAGERDEVEVNIVLSDLNI